MKKTLIRVAAILASSYITFTLTGCANAALAITDPRSITTLTDDQYIMRNLQIKYTDKEFESANIQTTVYNHEVLLNGQALNLIQRHRIVEAAKNMERVTKVYDYMYIAKTDTASTTNDTMITATVKSKLFASEDVNSNDVKIVTYAGDVYILGIIKEEQLKNMVTVASNVDGVKKVIPLVHYKTSDSKLNLPGTE